MTRYAFMMHGEPRPLARARHFVRGNHVGTYDPESNRAAKHDLKMASLQSRPAQPLEGAIQLTLVFVRQYPKSMPMKKRPGAHPVTRPDLDNYVKMLLDALNGIYWRDDSQVVSIVASKVYGDAAEVNVIVESLEPKGTT